MDAEAMLKISRAVCRKCRKHLRMNVTMRHIKNIDLRRIAFHESAHCVVALAYGVPVLFVHTSPVLGGRRIGILPDHDGMFCMSFGESDRDAVGPVALAGMIQDRYDWIGPADAIMLLRYLTSFSDIGRYPSMKPALVDKTIAFARRNASEILRRERKAVRAVADLFMTPGRVHFDGAEIDAVARAASSTLPEMSVAGREDTARWAAALAGDDAAAARVGSDIVILVRKERAKKRRAKRPTLDPSQRPATPP